MFFSLGYTRVTLFMAAVSVPLNGCGETNENIHVLQVYNIQIKRSSQTGSEYHRNNWLRLSSSTSHVAWVTARPLHMLHGRPRDHFTCCMDYRETTSHVAWTTARPFHMLHGRPRDHFKCCMGDRETTSDVAWAIARPFLMLHGWPRDHFTCCRGDRETTSDYYYYY